MAVTIDHEPLAAEQMGYRTIGQVLAHIQKDNRLVTSLLIDGLEPDLDRIGSVRQALLTAHTIFIETADPSKMAIDVLCEVEDQLGETDRLRLGASTYCSAARQAGHWKNSAAASAPGKSHRTQF